MKRNYAVSKACKIQRGWEQVIYPDPVVLYRKQKISPCAMFEEKMWKEFSRKVSILKRDGVIFETTLNLNTILFKVP